MYRNAMAKLLSWSDSPSRKPLIVNGARQVGKTWLVLAFGEDRYDSVAHIVFLDNEDMKRAFEGSLDAERLLTIIGAATGTNPRDGRTLVFLDEIQECPRAITALKMFCEQRPLHCASRRKVPGLAVSSDRLGHAPYVVIGAQEIGQALGEDADEIGVALGERIRKRRVANLAHELVKRERVQVKIVDLPNGP